MSIPGILTGGLGYSPPGVGYIPTWGLVPGSSPKVFLVRAAASSPFTLAASASATLTVSGSLVMAAPAGHIGFYSGEAVSVRFVLDGAPVSAGWTTLFTLFGPSGASVLSAAGTGDSPAVGTVLVALSHAQTVALVGPYRYEMHRTDSGSETMLSAGTADVWPALLP